MTYLQFHLLFLLPPLLLLAAQLPGALRRLEKPGWFIPLLALIAFVYTTPWDNYLVWRGVWGYGGERVIGTVGYVPIEEYAFFLLQPVITGMWLYVLLAGAPTRSPPGRVVRAAGTILYGSLTVAGVLLLATDRGLYAGLILAWAGPVLLGQWLWAADAVWRQRRAAVWGIAVPTLYLWAADGTAIANGVWTIAPQWSTGWMIGPLPVEEALFFLVTNLLVVQGLLLFLFPDQSSRRATALPAAAHR